MLHTKNKSRPFRSGFAVYLQLEQVQLVPQLQFSHLQLGLPQGALLFRAIKLFVVLFFIKHCLVN